MGRKTAQVCLLVATFSASLSGCGQAPEPGSADHEAAILEMLTQRLERIQSGADLESKVAAYMSVVAEDAVWMPPNSPPVEGPEAIEEWARSFFGSWVLAVDSISSSVIEVGSDIAVRRFRSVGNYIPAGGGEAVPYDQKYLDHFRLREDGTWEIVVHMWSPNSTEPNIWQ